MSGRKPLPKNEKRQIIAIRLPPETIKFLRENKKLGSQSNIILHALQKTFEELR